MPSKCSKREARPYVVSVEYTILCTMDVRVVARNAAESKRMAEVVVNDTDMMCQTIEHMGITNMRARLED